MLKMNLLWRWEFETCFVSGYEIAGCEYGGWRLFVKVEHMITRINMDTLACMFHFNKPLFFGGFVGFKGIPQLLL